MVTPVAFYMPLNPGPGPSQAQPARSGPGQRPQQRPEQHSSGGNRPGAGAGAPPSTGPAPGLSVGLSVPEQDLVDRWPEVIQEILKRKPTLGSHLVRSSLSNTGGGRITVVLPQQNRFGLGQLNQPENKKHLQEIMSGITGTRLEVQCVPGDPGEARRRQAPPGRPGTSPGQEGPEEGVRRVLDIFEGTEMSPDESGQ